MRGGKLNEFKIVGIVFLTVILSIVGAVVGMVIGAIVFPMKILEGRASIADIKTILTKTDSNKDQI